MSDKIEHLSPQDQATLDSFVGSLRRAASGAEAPGTYKTPTLGLKALSPTENAAVNAMVNQASSAFGEPGPENPIAAAVIGGVASGVASGVAGSIANKKLEA